jgi:hypothetical protein
MAPVVPAVLLPLVWQGACPLWCLLLLLALPLLLLLLLALCVVQQGLLQLCLPLA